VQWLGLPVLSQPFIRLFACHVFCGYGNPLTQSKNNMGYALYLNAGNIFQM